MLHRSMLVSFLAALAFAASAAGQTALTLDDAIARARANNPDAAASAAAERESKHRLNQARAGYWPSVDLVESWQRGNQPVFVFGSLLTQRRFTAADFALDALNHPDAVDNFRSALSLEQPLFVAGTRANVAAARIDHDLAGTARNIVGADLAVAVTQAYGGVLVAAGARRSAAAAIERALADRALAAARRDAGLATDADVLQVDVHVTRTREQQIRADADERIARARLNQLIGEPLGAMLSLEPIPPVTTAEAAAATMLESEAIAKRPEVRAAALREDLARAREAAARAAFLPHVSVQAGWEFNGGTWNSRASSWVIGAVARVNLFRGLGDKARLAEAREAASRRAIERAAVDTAARLDVHTALARLEAARATESVGRDAVTQARESQRIVRDRYQAGLADVSSLLRAAEALVQAELQQLAAQVAIVNENAALSRALGR